MRRPICGSSTRCAHYPAPRSCCARWRAWACHRATDGHPLSTLRTLARVGVPHAIATSSRSDSAGPALQLLGVGAEIPVVTREQVEHAKPDPDLFMAAAERLGVPIHDAIVVGDSIWDLLAARRARALGVGLLSGGYGQEELERAGAYRVYQDPAELLRHLDELGIRWADAAWTEAEGETSATY